ncbi:MAG: hypothetical protein KAT28_01130 [Candidatus Aenigmarchaeota archaeon]|nr:hypothetical protein [Candidatus Aenigmarchaeota archaeon]
MEGNIELYKELLGFCEEIREKQKFKFDSNLNFSNFNEKCYIEMYLKNKVSTRPLVFKKGSLPELKDVCSKCAMFHTSKRNEMIKGFDIQFGHWFEKAFRDFLLNKGIKTEKKGFPFPDIEVIKNGVPVAYFELKYIRSPFVYANNQLKMERWCYECSLTLDVGDKLSKQRTKIEDNIISKNIPVFYVWWYDAPCVKGIFYMTAEKIFTYWDKIGTSHNRKEREGDLEVKQEKGKIYPPLLEMKGLKEFIGYLKGL